MRYHLTFDVDWAPDFALEDILACLSNHNVKATFFVTHPSDIIDDLLAAGHHVGLHPNFLPGSSQGTGTVSIIENLLALHPAASCIRTHSLVQSSPLLFEIFSNFPQLRFDLSTLTYKFPHVAAFDWIAENLTFKRINYNWEDDVAFFDKDSTWDSFKPFADLTVFDFHPIHVALNSRSVSPYRALKERLRRRPLHSANRQEIAGLRGREPGAGDLLCSVLSSPMRPITFSELACV